MSQVPVRGLLHITRHATPRVAYTFIHKITTLLATSAKINFDLRISACKKVLMLARGHLNQLSTTIPGRGGGGTLLNPCKSREFFSHRKGYLAHAKQPPSQDPTGGPCLGPYGGPRGGGSFL